MQHLLADVLEKGAVYWRDRPGLISAGRVYTFAQTFERSNRLGNALLALGLQRGQRAGVLLNNCSEHVEVYFAKTLAGLGWVNLSWRLTDDELCWQITDADVQVLVVGAKHLERVAALRDRIPSVRHYVAVGAEAAEFRDYEDLVEGGSPDTLRQPGDPSDIVRIAYTGGTTGRPKGIVIPRRSDEAVFRNILLDNVADLNSSDIFLGLQPLYHAVWTFIMPCWTRGVLQVLDDDWSPSGAFETIRRHQVTIVKTVPTVLVRLLNELAEPEALRSVRTIIYGAAPMPVEKLREGIERLGPIFVQNYGQAEAPMTISTLSKKDHEPLPDGTNPRLASVGRPYSYVQVRIVDDDGQPVEPNEVGEVAVRGDHVMAGYWHQPEEVTSQAMRDGWVYTRDVGRIDRDGYLYLVDRKSDMIISGGLNVYPNEVEQALHEHPDVLEVGVVGAPDPEWGETIKAFVVLRDGATATPEELTAFCSGRLARYKLPRAIVIADSLPKSPMGKILRRELRER